MKDLTTPSHPPGRNGTRSAGLHTPVVRPYDEAAARDGVLRIPLTSEPRVKKKMAEIQTPEPTETTLTLLERAQAGDDAALNALCLRYLPRLERWAHGQLPMAARGALETRDVVQEVFISTIRNLSEFSAEHRHSFQGYLRTAVRHRIIDEVNRIRRRPDQTSLDPEPAGRQPSPLEEVIGHDTAERFERAMARLSADDRQAVFMRIEQQYDFHAIAEITGKSYDAARMTVHRALLRLAKEMRDESQ